MNWKTKIEEKSFEGPNHPDFGNEKHLEHKWAKSKVEKFANFENEKSNFRFFVKKLPKGGKRCQKGLKGTLRYIKM